MRVYDDICDMLNDELEQIVQKHELTSNALDIMYKITDVVKDIKTIEAMEESGYANHYPWYMYSDDPMGYSNGSYDGNSYGRGRNARRDSMGRYSRDGYSRDDQMTNQLQQMMNNAKTDQEREMIRQWMEQSKRQM